MARIGLFGGTFDPLHVGHLAVASAAGHALGLAEVHFVVAHRPWQKVGTRQIAPSPLRLAMVEAATAHRDDFVASSVEIDRGGSSYTIDTVETLLATDAEAGIANEYVLVVGSDVVGDLDTWHRHEELRELVGLAVIDRPGDIGVTPPEGWKFDRVDAPLVNLSSSMLRARLAAGEPVDYLVPREALAVFESWRDEGSAEPRPHPEQEATE
ncbi:MAG: nicotinate (nicotinamide) nucleotide adenylyltransferase [Actinomycetota bacterium]